MSAAGMNEPLAVREAPASYQVVLEPQRVRPGYKQTEVGVIPEDWEMVYLGNLFDISAGRDLMKEHFSAIEDGKYRYPIYANGLTNKGLYGYSDILQYEAEKITVTARGDVGSAVYRGTSIATHK